MSPGGCDNIISRAAQVARCPGWPGWLCGRRAEPTNALTQRRTGALGTYHCGSGQRSAVTAVQYGQAQLTATCVAVRPTEHRRVGKPLPSLRTRTWPSDWRQRDRTFEGHVTVARMARMCGVPSVRCQCVALMCCMCSVMCMCLNSKDIDFEFGTPLGGYADAFLLSCVAFHRAPLTMATAAPTEDASKLYARPVSCGNAEKLKCCLRSDSLCGSPLCYTDSHTVLTHTHSHCRTSTATATATTRQVFGAL
jgi:hypothetical protein